MFAVYFIILQRVKIFYFLLDDPDAPPWPFPPLPDPEVLE